MPVAGGAYREAVTDFDREWPEPSPVPDDLAPQHAARPMPVRRRGVAMVIGALVMALVLAVATIGAAFVLRPEVTSAPPPGPVAPAERLEDAPARPQVVVYEVTSGGAGDIGSIEYTDQDGDIIRRGGVPLPWRVTFTVTGDHHRFVLLAQRKKGGAGEVTCSITVGEKVLTTVTQTGRCAAPQCSA
jgi:hypothetical protein